MQSGTKEANLTHLAHDLYVKVLISVSLQNPRLQFRITECASAIKDGPLFVR